MTLELNPQQLQVLVGLLDIAVKQVGIRALEPDVVGIFDAIKAAAAAAQEPATAE